MNSNVDGFIKALGFILRLNRVTDYRAIRHDPAAEDVAIGQGDDSYRYVVVRLLHKFSTHDFYLHESLAIDGNKNLLDSFKLAGGLLQ